MSRGYHIQMSVSKLDCGVGNGRSLRHSSTLGKKWTLASSLLGCY